MRNKIKSPIRGMWRPAKKLNSDDIRLSEEATAKECAAVSEKVKIFEEGRRKQSRYDRGTRVTHVDEVASRIEEGGSAIRQSCEYSLRAGVRIRTNTNPNDTEANAAGRNAGVSSSLVLVMCTLDRTVDKLEMGEKRRTGPGDSVDAD